MANQLAGRWVGRPQIKTIEYDIEIEFVKTGDSVMGKLVQTTLPDPREPKPIDKPFRNFKIDTGMRRLNWTFPNTQEWGFAGELSADGREITGVTSSAQGGARITFRKR